MGLRGAIAQAVSSAFTAVGDIPQTVVYRRSVNTYVPSTGVLTAVNTDYTISAILLRFTEIELNRMVNMQLTDQKMLIQSKSLTITPNIQTDHVIYNNKTWSIVTYNTDPAGATISFQLRTT